jgi:hypothetical protein
MSLDGELTLQYAPWLQIRHTAVVDPSDPGTLTCMYPSAHEQSDERVDPGLEVQLAGHRLLIPVQHHDPAAQVSHGALSIPTSPGRQ